MLYQPSQVQIVVKKMKEVRDVVLVILLRSNHFWLFSISMT